MESILKNISLTDILNLPVDEALENTENAFLEFQETICRLKDMDASHLSVLKMGTILSFAILKKYGMGKTPDRFTAEDYMDIAQSISKYAICMDGGQYSAFIFLKYAEFIDASLLAFDQEDIPEKEKLKLIEISLLSEQLKEKTEQFTNGEINETVYTEDCLWLALEAMFRLLLVTKMKFPVEEYTDFAQAFTMLTFQMGRYSLYNKENEVLEHYFKEQQDLDEALDAQYESYLQNLQNASRHFNELIDHAFEKDFKDQFQSSILLGKEAGLAENEILKNEADIDSFFLD